MHGYAVGEFGPGGLYHNVAGVPATDGTAKGVDARFHPNMPVQNHNSVWTFDGTLPPKLLMVRYGQPLLMRHYNGLPIDPSANMGFGLHTISTHEHNGHAPAESDGYANAFFFPGQYYDYRWPIQLAGYDSINTDAPGPARGVPLLARRNPVDQRHEPGPQDLRERHDQDPWRLARNHEHPLVPRPHARFHRAERLQGQRGDDELLQRAGPRQRVGERRRQPAFPQRQRLAWGNRDYDVNLVFADKAWDANGQLWFNPFNTDGFLGDQVLVNWQWKPTLDVRARSYRFRMLNGSVSRYFKLALVREIKGTSGEFQGPKGSGVSYARVPFHMIANDGNIMEHSVPFDGTMDLDADGDKQNHNAILPTQGIAERFDIIVNFAKNGIKPGDKLFFVNLLVHDDGKGPKEPVSLADVLSEKYLAVIKQTSKGPMWDKGDPAVGKVLQLNVKPYTGQDLAMDPAAYEPAKPGKAEGLVMIPLKIHRDNAADKALLAKARHRTFIFGRSDGTDEAPWTVKTDGGFGFHMDPRRLNASTQLASGPTDAGVAGLRHPGGVEHQGRRQRLEPPGACALRGRDHPQPRRQGPTGMGKMGTQGRVPHRLGKGWPGQRGDGDQLP